MTSQRAFHALILCLVIGPSDFLFSQEANEPDVNLIFEVVPGPNEPNDTTLEQMLCGTHFAELTVNESPFFFVPAGPRLRPDRFFTYLMESEALTSMQRALIRRSEAGNRRPVRPSSPGFFTQTRSERGRHIKIQAVTEKDVRAMSQLYLNYMVRGYTARKKELSADVASKTRRIKGLQQTVSAYESELPKAEKAFEELRAQVFYRSSQDAEKAIQELNRILTATRIDIAGQESAVETIWEYRKRPVRRTATYAKSLEQMLLEHNISLKASQARGAAARSARAQAIRFIELEGYTVTTPRKLQEAKLRLSGTETQLAKLKEELADLVKPEVIDNKVAIYKIEEEPAN